MSEALESLRILDFSRVLAGPLATMMLADLGATVTKVERPGTGDDTRSWGPPYDARGMATYFQSVNRNKQSVALDLRDTADLELARWRSRPRRRRGRRELPARASWTARPRLRAAAAPSNPALVYCSITGFGAAAAARRPARLRPARPGARRPDEHHGRPPTASRRRSASRSSTCSRGCSRRSGSWRRCATATRPARASGRGQPAVGAAGGAGQPGLGVHGRGRRARPDGQRAPEHLAV